MVIVKMTEEQANVVLKALDLYSRLHLGQFREIQTIWQTNYLWAKETLKELKKQLTGLEENEYHSICAEYVSQNAKIAYDILQTIRHRMAWDKNPNGGLTVDYDEPLNVSNLPLPEVKSE